MMRATGGYNPSSVSITGGTISPYVVTQVGDLVYSYSAGVLQMVFRATSARDVKLTFKAAGSNSIFDLTNYDYANNGGTPPTLSRNWSSVWSGSTDTIGPFYVSADANGDGSPTVKFTGGAHDNGSGSPSANVKSIAIYADGAQLVDGADGAAKEISIVQVIGVQGWNTTGSAREILTETRNLTFDRWGMRASISVAAKENVHIQRYYGAQMVGVGFNTSVHFVNGIPTVSGTPQPQGRYSIGAGAEVDSGAYTTYPGVNMIALRGVWGDMTCMLDTTYGLGASRTLDAGQPSAKWSTSSGSKAYWQLVFVNTVNTSTGVALTTGQTVAWRASYTWGDKISASSNVDATVRYQDKGSDRMKIIFSASGAGQLSMLPVDCNKALSVIGGTAAGTVDAISSAALTTATGSGYGDLEFTIL